MKSWPDPNFWKWKIKVQNIKPSVSGVCWKSKTKMAQEMKTAVLSMCSKETLNDKISTLPQRTVNHILFIPPSFRSHIVSMPCWHGKCQSFQRWHIIFFCGNSSPCYTTHLSQPILNQSPKDTPLNFTSLGLRLSSHTSLFWTLPGLLSMLHHAPVPTHPEPTF